jgi:molecular chaperone GrpE
MDETTMKDEPVDQKNESDTTSQEPDTKASPAAGAAQETAETESPEPHQEAENAAPDNQETAVTDEGEASDKPASPQEKNADEKSQQPDNEQLISAHAELLDEKLNPLKEGISGILNLQKIMNEGMHQELEDYKNKFLNGIHTPLLKNFLRLYDSFQNNLEHIQDEDAKSRLQFICDELLAILESYDVEMMPVEENALFDPLKHKALKRVDTEDPSLHKKIESVLRRGFYRAEQVLRPQEVSVYFCVKSNSDDKNV